LLLISNILLWIAVLALVVVVFALTRQIGVLYERVAPAGALAMNQNLTVGEAAPELALATLDGKMITIGGVSEEGKSQMIFFASPDCPVCKTLLPALKSAAKAEADWLRLIIGSDGDNQDHNSYVQQHGLQEYPYIVSELLGKTYSVAKLPYAVVIDEQGKLASLGIVNSREHLDSLFEAKERNVASIQEFLNEQNYKNENVKEVTLK
jgi:methylamine dehydrogenase accessory protein MauD